MQWCAAWLVLVLAAPLGQCSSYSEAHNAEGDGEDPASPTSYAATAPVVRVAQGPLRGRVVQQTRQSPTQYFAFEGIPYAAAPVGDRRFQAPGEPINWTEIRNVIKPRPSCIYKDKITNEVLGIEDCLYLNVYTVDPPEFWDKFKLPVIVWFSPLYIGSRSLDLLNPSPILNKRCVLITLNIRQGVMGYLNTEDSDAPGNAALKDAVKALQWIKKNIGVFGGNNSRITVMGDGTGGAVVNYLLLSSQCKDLFHAAVSFRGNALSPWFSSQRRREFAVSLYEHFQNSHCRNVSLIGCLKGVDAAELVGYEDVVFGEEPSRFSQSPFMPSVEAPGSSDAPFLATEPQNILRAGHFLNVPYMVGLTSAESIINLRVSQLLRNVSRSPYFEQVIQAMMPSGLQTAAATRETMSFYLGDSFLRDAPDNPRSLNKIVRMVRDLLVGTGSVSMARLMAQRGARVFLCEFAYEDRAEYLKDEVYGAAALSGVAHADDVFFLFEEALREDTSERQRWMQMFTNFAKRGTPTPLGVEEWTPYNDRDENYMHVDNQFAMKKHVLGDRIVFWRQLARCSIPDVCEENPIVYTQEGYVRGRRQQSVAGCSYFSWQGIPYAKPPVGPLRFKDSERPEPWTGVRDALQEGSICPQATSFSNGGNITIAGNEDCLFVNVYSPHLPTWLLDSVPTMHWVHGGAFLASSGNQNGMGPDYMICEGVLITTINYRLGPFGFLYLEEAAPGNAGLKDQVMSLRWVQRNIAAFLGMPQQVTIAGISAGGASVHYLLLSPLTKGLFRRAIAESGNALSAPANPLETSRSLVTVLGCDRNDTFAAVDCLRELPIATIIAAAMGPAITPDDRERIFPYTFVPTQDFPSPDAELFLPAPAIEIVRNAAQQPLPLLTGFTSRESILALALLDFRNKTVAAELDASWDVKIWPELFLPATDDKKPALNDLRQFYMKGRPLNNDTLLQFMDMLTDIYFAKAVYYNLEIWAKANRAPLYEYFFDVDDQLNVFKKSINASDIPGAEHGSDGNYLFKLDALPEVAYNSSAALTRRRMVRMWTNYAKFGVPTPVEDPLLQNIHWKPYKSNRKNYLYIGKNLQLRKNLNEERENFWRRFYKTYGSQE